MLKAKTQTKRRANTICLQYQWSFWSWTECKSHVPNRRLSVFTIWWRIHFCLMRKSYEWLESVNRDAGETGCSRDCATCCDFELHDATWMLINSKAFTRFHREKLIEQMLSSFSVVPIQLKSYSRRQHQTVSSRLQSLSWINLTNFHVKAPLGNEYSHEAGGAEKSCTGWWERLHQMGDK